MEKPDDYKKCLAPFEALSNEYAVLRKKYANSFEELSRMAEENVVRREYAMGGEAIHRGVYNPGMLDLIFVGMNRGRLLKKPPKDNHYSYEYLFDTKDRMICVKNYDKYSDYRMTGIEFLMYEGDLVFSVSYDPSSLLSPNELSGVSRCRYEDGKLMRYESSGGFRSNTDDIGIGIEEFQYENDLVTSMFWSNFSRSYGSTSLIRRQIFFNRDEEGFLSTYAMKEISGVKKPYPDPGILDIYEIVGAKRKKKQAPKIQKTISLQTYLENKVRDVISSWDEEGIYAISFFVYANESYEYKGFTNVTEFSVSYNTEQDCEGADERSEERWNYAFWRQNETPILQADEEDEGMKLLFDWYAKKGIKNIGYEDFDACYDDNMRYIGKGPVGYYELLSEITAVAKKLQDSGFIRDKFGAPIPIIIHDLEYPWYVIEATKQANSHGEADTFLAAMKELGFTE